jgi:hypothetical protein
MVFSQGITRNRLSKQGENALAWEIFRVIEEDAQGFWKAN